ncbi:MAG: ABC transporter ATP-binding protein [Clostridia bacterium]|nr:ABC transporter ATP-binding protein [Clostridia bacterium]
METTKSNKHSISDYEHLFREAEEQESKKHHSNGIPKMLLKQNSIPMIISALLYIVKSLAIWVIPLITAEIINIVTRNDADMSRKLLICAAILVVLLLSNYPLHIVWSKYVDQKLRAVSAGLKTSLIRKLQHLSITYHNEIESGKVQSKFMRDIEAVEMLCNHVVKGVIPCFLQAILSIIISVEKSPTVTIFFMLVIPINILLVQLFHRSMQSTNRTFRIENENVTAKMSDMLEMIPVTKAHGLEAEEISVLERRIEILRKKGLSVDKVNAKFASVSWITSQLMSCSCLFFTAYLAVKGEIGIGDIVLYQSYFNSISNNINAIINIYPQLTKGTDSIQSLSEILLSNEVENNTNKIKLRYVHGSVEFDNVNYRYPKAKERIIKGLSFSVDPGECIAFVGSSGAGKTTVMNMIIGFLQATEGIVKIDGKPIEMLDLSKYRSFISVVPQSCILFTGSIRENITYGLTNITEERLQEVVRLSNIDEFVKDLPQGLDTPVGENGAKLSGGQKQRISIARALIRDPKILILDEATSALDNISEYNVQKAIGHLTKGRTTFVVAHRLSTIRNADRIVVMENGRCVEMGSYNELMEKKGKFYELKSLTERTPEFE